MIVNNNYKQRVSNFCVSYCIISCFQDNRDRDFEPPIVNGKPSIMAWVNSSNLSFWAPHPEQLGAIDVAACKRPEELDRGIKEDWIWRHNVQGVLQQLMENQTMNTYLHTP